MTQQNPSTSSEMDLDGPNPEEYLPSESIQKTPPHENLRLCDLLDISPALTEAAGAIVDDSFTRCFKSIPPEPWNWNIYLFPLWCCGVVVRYGILFPIRVLVLTIGWIIFLSAFIPVHFLLKGNDKWRKKAERYLVELICSFFVASWTGVVKYHGPRPSVRPRQVFVANHTSMIDFIVLEQMTAFAVITQKHPGWVGLLQSRILESVGCIWFNRSEAKYREMLARKKVPTMKEMFDLWKKKKNNTFGIIYSWFLAKVASKLEVFPGSEFRVAFEEARKYGGEVILGDRPVQITLRRTWAKMSMWHKVKFIFGMVFQSIFLPSPKALTKMLKDMDDADMLTVMTREMSKKFPTVMETLVHERDLYMTSCLLRVASEHTSVVAVVGRGHLAGITKHWKEPIETKHLLEIPTKTPMFSAKRVLKFGVVAGVAVVFSIYLGRKM